MSSYYCTKTGGWIRLDRMASLPYPEQGSLEGFRLAVVNGELYAAGGECKIPDPVRGPRRYTKQCLDNFCKYNVDTNKWLELPPMMSMRKSFVMLDHKRDVFVFGGRTTARLPVMGVEKFNSVEHRWIKCSSFPMGLSLNDMSAVSFGDMIIVVGSRVIPTSDLIIQLFMYDPSKDVWHFIELNENIVSHNMCRLLLTSHVNKLFLVYSDLIQSRDLVSQNNDMIPKVQEVKLNFINNTASLSAVDQKQNRLMSPRVQAFCIGDCVFVSRNRCVLQVNAVKGDDSGYDLSKWEELDDQDNAFKVIVLFTIDKQQLIRIDS